MKRYYIKTYGCQMNIHESEKIAGILRNLGYTETSEQKDGDIIVFNTCCIRETAEAKIAGHIGEVARLKQQNSGLIVAVTGCMSQQEGAAESLKRRFPFIDIILGTSNLHLLAEKIEAVNTAQPRPRQKTAAASDGESTVAGPLPNAKTVADNRANVLGAGDGVPSGAKPSLKFSGTQSASQKRGLIDVAEYASVAELPSYRTSGANAWVNIIYGCNNFCTYCIVPYVRGRERSRAREDIIAEVEGLLSKGYKEITLLGQNVNSYGKDTGGAGFASLLEALATLPYKYRLRFLTSHPKDLTDAVIDAVVKYGNICKSIHLPVQSGSTDVLSRMNRRYTKEDYLALVARIKSKIPGVGLSSDIMVGFPGETEENFQDTLDVVRKARFASCFCFIYSRRKGTPGYAMENQIPREIKTDRIKRLIAEQNKITREISKAFEGKTVEILADGLNDKYEGVYCGRTDCGKLVNFKCAFDPTGQFVNVKVTRSQSATLFGEIVN